MWPVRASRGARAGRVRMSAGGAAVAQDERRHGEGREGVEGLVRVWARWATGPEVVWVLDVVAEELRARGWTVTVTIEPPRTP